MTATGSGNTALISAHCRVHDAPTSPKNARIVASCCARESSLASRKLSRVS